MSQRKLDYKFYYVYKTTNLITGKIYVGQRSTNKDPIRDSYLGSGTLFKKSVKKHGKENFKKEILEFCTNVDEMNQREIFWIEELKSTNILIGYNLTKGGEGGGMPGALNPMFGKCGDKNPFYNKYHSKETKIILSERAKNRKVLKCPYCGMKMNSSNAIQYHFDNCLKNPNISKKIIEERILRTKKGREKSKEKLICPYCGAICSHTNSKKYHFENCEKAPILSQETLQRIIDKESTKLRRKERDLKKKKNPELLYCPYCGLKSYDRINMNRYHFENCKQNPNRKPILYKCNVCGLETENKTNITRWHNENCKQNFKS